MARRSQGVDEPPSKNVRFVLQFNIDEKAVGAVALRGRERLAGDRYEPASVFAGGFGEELLQPGAESRDRRRCDDGRLVAPEAPRRDAQGDAELHARIFRAGGTSGPQERSMGFVASRSRSTWSPIAAAGARPNFDSTEYRPPIVGAPKKMSANPAALARSSSAEPGSVTATKCSPARSRPRRRSRARKNSPSEYSAPACPRISRRRRRAFSRGRARLRSP